MLPPRRKSNVLPPLQFIMTEPQQTIFDDPARFRIVIAGRRFGKTFLGKYEVIRAALKAPNQQVLFVFPTYRMSKLLGWIPLKEFMPTSYIRKKNETDLSMTLHNGSVIRLAGSDNPDALRGVSLDFVILDEACYQDSAIWDSVLRPALADRHGRAMWISTPAGFDWVWRLIEQHNSDVGWSYHHYTTIEGQNITEDEIAAARRDMDPSLFRQEMEASFEVMSGLVYSSFDIKQNVVDLSSSVTLSKDTNTTLYIGIDFNVGKLYAIVCVLVSGVVHVVDTIKIVNGSTDIVAKEIRRRYPTHNIVGLPDPTGDSRKTNAPVGVTDFVILREYRINVVSPGHAYPVKDKINCMNRAFCNADGKHSLLIHKENNKDLISGLMGLTYIEGTTEPNKSLDIDHPIDALFYAVGYLKPVAAPFQRIPVTGA